MGCNRPLQVYKKPGEGSVSFSVHKAGAVLPAKIPCGQCMGCRLERSREWKIRIAHEAQMHDKNAFLTLTYDPEFYPEDGSLDVRDWQLFAKRARKKYGPFRFFHCGEYGRLGRAHYHAAIFGLDWADTRTHHKDSVSKRGVRSPLFVDEGLTKCWGKGYVYIGELNPTTAGYISGYIIKKQRGRLADNEYGDRKHPYITMSRKPGLGRSWFDQFKSDVYPRGEVVMEGIVQKPPAYYDSLYEKEDPEGFVALAKRRRKYAKGKEVTQRRGEDIDKCLELKGKHFQPDY